MKIAVIGANGKEGSMIVKETQSRNIDVTSIVRDAKKSPTDKYIVSDIFGLKKEDIKSFDAVVNATGFFGDDVVKFVPSIEHLVEIFSGEKTRLLVVGGAGSLYLDDSHTQKLYQSDGFPDSVKPLSEEMGKSLDVLKKSNINWTYVSPAADFDFKAEKTGKYVVAGEELTFDKNNNSKISYADYAIAMVDEIEESKHENERISVRW
ncbi:NAD(P)-dependent oxidoreductase [Companilactobacillus mishanensis]|uniref:NAD(P)-dependent oxidoreductase n=1 Tax=Companilactobacillus mishanensis TaxID=2486008 RepID=UPI001294D917|nr:NAD(P)H-binding protein [Companilactobacillus mishanensis]MQS89770.1 NAD(P)-dependent oxidoreductase [Companilactobacillus mishanensis]